MRSLKSRLLGCAVAGVLGTVAVVGCSASGDTGDIIPATNTDPTDDNDDVALPPSSSGSTSNADAAQQGTTDGGKKDGGSKDAGKDAGKKDAGAPAPETGTACPKIDDIFKRSCGKCGMQEALCVPNKNGSGGVVDAYGVCKNESQTGCVPGSTEDVSCGNCGTQKRTCNNYCEWVTAACTGQPTDSCTPGAVELTGASCGANLYRQRSCKAACTWDTYSSTCSPPPTSVLVPPNAGSVNSTIVVLDSTKTTIRSPNYGTCPIPVATKFATFATPYAYIEVRNKNPKAVTVTIYNSQASGGPLINTLMVAYDGTTIPTTETERRNCKGAIGDNGSTALTGDYYFAALDLTKAVTIPANSSVQVYVASSYQYDSADPAESTGMVMLNVRTDSVAP